MNQYRIKSLDQFKKIIPLKLVRDEQVTDAIAIVRRSSDGQKDNNSEAVQLETIQRYAAGKKLNLLAIFCIIESAKSSEDRKLYQAIEEWADANKLKHRVFYKPDRETRNLTDIEKSLNRVRIGEIIVHYALENKVLDENIIPSEMLQRSMVGVFDAHY